MAAVPPSSPRVQGPNRDGVTGWTRQTGVTGWTRQMQSSPGHGKGERVRVRRGGGTAARLGHGELGQSGWLCLRREPWDPTCFQCQGRATSACAHLPAALGCACPSLLPSPLRSPPPPLCSLPSSLPLAPSLTRFSGHPFPSRRLSSPQRPATKAKLGPHCGVSPLPRTLPVCANPSLNPKNLLGAGISLRLPATHAFPPRFASSPWLHERLGRRQGDRRDTEPVRAHGPWAASSRERRQLPAGAKVDEGKA